MSHLRQIAGGSDFSFFASLPKNKIAPHLHAQTFATETKYGPFWHFNLMGKWCTIRFSKFRVNKQAQSIYKTWSRNYDQIRQFFTESHYILKVS